MLTLQEYRALLRSDFMTFAERAFRELEPDTPFVMSPHLELMAAKLEACRNGTIRRLIVNLPPRSLKSHFTTVAFVAWILGHRPDRKVICASYGQDLADKHARDTRKLMTSPFYKRVFPTRLAASRLAVSDFETTAGGGRMATSVGGVLTGRGADVIIVDDPQKPDEALSDTARKSANQWFDNSLLSRLNNKATGCIIVVMQRLHQDDLVGHVLEQDDRWEVVSFPAIAETDETVEFDTPLGRQLMRRKAGEALDPAREGLDTLAMIRRQIGEYNFQGQYQQKPTPVSGNMVKRAWLKYFELGEQPATFDFVLQSWDTANKSGELNDYSVCTTWGVKDRRFYLLDVYRARLNYPELKRAIRTCAERYAPNKILIEDKASGTQLIQDLLSEGLNSVLAYDAPPGNDKVMRLHAQTASFENGCVLLPSYAPWLSEYLSELTGFPGTKYDDQVDSTTQALAHLSVPSGIENWIRFGANVHRFEHSVSGHFG